MTMMNRTARRLAAVFLLTCAILLCILPVSARQNEISGTVTVGQSFEIKNGNQPSASSEFTYRLTYAGEEDITEGAEPYSFTLTGKDSVVLPFSFTHAGVYRYRLEPVIEEKLTGYAYDESIYDIYAYVENREEELTLYFVVTDENGEKVDGIVYENTFAVQSSEESPKTGDNSRITLWLLLMLFSGMIVLVLLRNYRKAMQ